MQLSYRGIPYQVESTVPSTIEHFITGRYRGSMFALQTRYTPQLPETIIGLQYRGATYLKW